MHACNPVYIVYTHENIVVELFKKNEKKKREIIMASCTCMYL